MRGISIMVKRRNGFTLVELLATITILGILLGIAIPGVLGYISQGKETYYHSLEDNVLNAARDYLIDYRSLYPREIGSTASINGDELINNKYIEAIDDEKGDKCSADVIIEKTDKDDYDYFVCLKCGNNYSSSEEICSMNGNDPGDTKNYVIEVGSFPTEVRQGDDLTLPLAKVYTVENGVRTLVTDALEATPQTIDTTVLGTTNVRWVYRYKSTNPKSVRVVDKVAPERPTVKLYYPDGSVYTGKNSNGNINITTRNIILEITSRDYACELGTTCRSRYPELEGSGVKQIVYRDENDTTDRIITTTKSVTRYTENETLWGNVTLKAVDNSNNVSENAKFTIYLDNENPSKTTVTYLGGSNTCSWKNNYKLKLNATDNIQVAYYEIYVDGTYYGTTDSEWTPPNNFSNCNTTFRAVDLAGNKGAFSDSHHIHMDTEKPGKTTVNLNGYTSDSWTNKNVTQTYSATDNVGVVYYEYAHSQNATNATRIDNPWVINWDGEWTFYVRAVDEAGNRGPWSNAYIVKRDTVKPTCSLTVTNNPSKYGNVYIANTNIGFSAYNDDRSKVKSTSVNTPTISTTTSNSGTVVTGTVVDNAGNSNTCNLTVVVDLKTPTAKPKSNPLTLGSGAYTFTNNLNIDAGPAGASAICNPATSRGSGSYSVTCTINGNNGKSSSVSFNVNHNYKSTSCANGNTYTQSCNPHSCCSRTEEVCTWHPACAECHCHGASCGDSCGDVCCCGVDGSYTTCENKCVDYTTCYDTCTYTRENSYCCPSGGTYNVSTRMCEY